MKILSNLKIENYRNLEKVELDSFSDINIVIGPNNCGKSSILKAISALENLKFSSNTGPECEICGGFSRVNNHKNTEIKIGGGRIENIADNKHKYKLDFKIAYEFEKGILKAPLITEDLFKNFENPANALAHIKDRMQKNEITIKSEENESYARVKHFVPSNFRVNICSIEDNRLYLYNDKKVQQYIVDKDLEANKLQRLARYLNSIADKKIMDLRSKSGDIIFSDDFEDKIENQGSGVRSLICMFADVLTLPQQGVILIDEPELGLTPAAKLELLKFLTDEILCKNYQIFLATHDPTFLNPLYLDREKTSIYLYSPISDNKIEPDKPNFVKINQNEPSESFGGYLPHTDSCKPIHIYVEGIRDVVAIQKLLIEILAAKKNLELLNKISVNHLGGDFWKHLLYTVLDKPYRSIILLDADKQDTVKKVCEIYSSMPRRIALALAPCNSKEKFRLALRYARLPICCLTSGSVENLTTNSEIKKEITEIIELFMLWPDAVEKEFQMSEEILDRIVQNM